MKKYRSLESIKQNIVICEKCNLCNDRKNAVPGKGNYTADIVFIGEAPGKNHGRLIYKNNRAYFITYHPAAIIYNQKLGKVFDADIKKMVSILQKLNKK